MIPAADTSSNSTQRSASVCDADRPDQEGKPEHGSHAFGERPVAEPGPAAAPGPREVGHQHRFPGVEGVDTRAFTHGELHLLHRLRHRIGAAHRPQRTSAQDRTTLAPLTSTIPAEALHNDRCGSRSPTARAATTVATRAGSEPCSIIAESSLEAATSRVQASTGTRSPSTRQVTSV